MKRVVVTDHAFVDTHHEQAAALAAGAEFVVHQCHSPQETTQAVRAADVVLVNFAPMGREQLNALAPGAVVIRYGVGVDNVDLATAAQMGVRVANVPDYGVDTVADHAAALLLALLRRVSPYDQGIREHGWVAPASVGVVKAFAQTTVGLVGAGRIARSFADRLRPFGFTVLASDPYVEVSIAADHGMTLVDLDTLLARSDAISLHLPATEQTRHFLNETRIAQLRQGCVVINTSRGALIEEAALAQAITSRHLGGAGLDVFDPEPLSPTSPLRSCDGVLLTPHAAFYSDVSLDNLQRLAADEAGRALRGEALRSPMPISDRRQP